MSKKKDYEQFIGEMIDVSIYLYFSNEGFKFEKGYLKENCFEENDFSEELRRKYRHMSETLKRNKIMESIKRYNYNDIDVVQLLVKIIKAKLYVFFLLLNQYISVVLIQLFDVKVIDINGKNTVYASYRKRKKKIQPVILSNDLYYKKRRKWESDSHLISHRLAPEDEIRRDFLTISAGGFETNRSRH